MARAHFIPLPTYEELPPEEMRREAEAFLGKFAPEGSKLRGIGQSIHQ